MITTVDRLVQRRTAGWSQQRRCFFAVLLMVAFFCSGLLAVPVVALDYTDEQGDAFHTPVEAIHPYL